MDLWNTDCINRRETQLIHTAELEKQNRLAQPNLGLMEQKPCPTHFKDPTKKSPSSQLAHTFPAINSYEDLLEYHHTAVVCIKVLCCVHHSLQ